jgi:predicted amidohydrolase YtcJ
VKVSILPSRLGERLKGWVTAALPRRVRGRFSSLLTRRCRASTPGSSLAGRGLVAALATLLLATPAFADTLIDNVRGYTLRGGDLHRFGAMLIGEDGRVKALYGERDRRPERPQYRLDGQGRVLIPGLFDAHGHVMNLGFQAMQLDLSGTRSLEEAQSRIAEHAARNPTSRWIVGRGWNQERWGLGRFPTAAEIDAVVADRPVWLTRVDGHAGWANSRAMEEAGVTARSVSPPGGRIEVANRRPTGVFIDAAMALVGGSVPPPLPVDRDRALETAQRIMLSNGLTAVADMGTSAEDWLVMRRAGDAGRLNVRILSYAANVEALLAVAGTGPTPWLYGNRLRMVGVKLYSDGALGSRGAWLKQPYRDAPGETGLAFLSDATLRNLMSRAAMDGFQVAVHAIGDAANEQLLGAIEELADTYKGDRRWRIEHAQIVDPADLPRFARHGIVASMQPVHQTSDMHMAEVRMGLPRLGGAYAWASMIASGVPLAFGSDFPVEHPNPFHGLAVAMSRQDEAGTPPGGWLAEQRISLIQALAGFTSTAAYAAFAEDRIGTLEPGRMADFLFIDRDIFVARDQNEIRGTQVLETWLGGRKVWERE